MGRNHRSKHDPWAADRGVRRIMGDDGRPQLVAGGRTASARVDRAGRYELTAPAAVGGRTFNGVRGGVQFVAGVGRTDDATRALALREQGYAMAETAAAGTADAGPESNGGGL